MMLNQATAMRAKKIKRTKTTGVNNKTLER